MGLSIIASDQNGQFSPVQALDAPKLLKKHWFSQEAFLPPQTLDRFGFEPTLGWFLFLSIKSDTWINEWGWISSWTPFKVKEEDFMFSRTLYVGLFVASGLCLSWSPVAPAMNWRAPASSDDCNIAGELLKGQTQINCSRVAKERDRKARSDVQVTTSYGVTESGEKVKTGIEVSTTVEANCDSCGVRVGAERETLVFTNDQLKDLNEVQRKILEMREKKEDEAFDKLRKEIALKSAVDKCLKNADGEKLDKEEKRECHLEKMAELDGEEAKKYFEKHFKEDLEKQLLSQDPKERAEALALLKQIKSDTLSSDLESDLKAMIQFGQDVEFIDQQKMQAEQMMRYAQSLPEGAQKQQLIQNAQNLLSGVETQIQNLRQTEMQKVLRGETVENSYLSKLEARLNDAYASSPELALLKFNGTDTTTNADDKGYLNADNPTRQQRGGNQVPGGYLTELPQTTIPQNLSQTGLPNAQNYGQQTGRGTAQDRLPAPMIQQQQPQTNINQMQPYPMNTIPNQNPYQWTYPMGNQFAPTNNTMAGTAPATLLPAY